MERMPPDGREGGSWPLAAEPHVTTLGSPHLPGRDFPLRRELSSETAVRCLRPGLLSGRAQGLLRPCPLPHWAVLQEHVWRPCDFT